MPLYISGAEVEQENSFRLLGMNITTLVKKKHRKGSAF